MGLVSGRFLLLLLFAWPVGLRHILCINFPGGRYPPSGDLHGTTVDWGAGEEKQSMRAGDTEE